MDCCSCPVKPFSFPLVPVLLLYLTAIAAGHVTPWRRGWAALEHVTNVMVRGVRALGQQEDALRWESSGSPHVMARATSQGNHSLPQINQNLPSETWDIPRTDSAAPLKGRG